MEPKKNPFIGIWEYEDGARLVFEEEIVTDYDPDGSIFWKGRYTYDNKKITIDWEYIKEGANGQGDTSTPYEFEKDVLIFGGNPLKKI